MLSQNMHDALNMQIKAEFYASHQYLSMSGQVDGNSTPQYWGYTKLDRAGARVAATVTPCDPVAGESVF